MSRLHALAPARPPPQLPVETIERIIKFSIPPFDPSAPRSARSHLRAFCLVNSTLARNRSAGALQGRDPEGIWRCQKLCDGVEPRTSGDERAASDGRPWPRPRVCLVQSLGVAGFRPGRLERKIMEQPRGALVLLVWSVRRLASLSNGGRRVSSELVVANKGRVVLLIGPHLGTDFFF